MSEEFVRLYIAELQTRRVMLLQAGDSEARIVARTLHEQIATVKSVMSMMGHSL